MTKYQIDIMDKGNNNLIVIAVIRIIINKFIPQVILIHHVLALLQDNVDAE